MKVVILAGGQGTRIAEYTKTIPKPMIQIKNKPIICHIIDHFYTFIPRREVAKATPKGSI